MERKNHPYVNALMRGAMLAAGYYGAKYLIIGIHDYLKNPDRKPIISIHIEKKENV